MGKVEESLITFLYCRKYRNIFDAYPYTIYKGKLYQLQENEETEELELEIAASGNMDK